MKRLKLLPTILMLVLCFGVLAIGVYALTPTQNTISGVVTINGANPSVRFTSYHIPYDTAPENVASACASGTLIDQKQARNSSELAISKDEDGKRLEFGKVGLNTLDDESLNPKLIAIKIENTSASTELGAYFATQTGISAPLTESTFGTYVVSEPIELASFKEDGTTPMDRSYAKATVSGYTKVPAKASGENGVAYVTIKIELSGELPTENVKVIPNIPFNIEEYNDDLFPKASYTITLDTGVTYGDYVFARDGWTQGATTQTIYKSIKQGTAFGTLPKPTGGGNKFLGWYTEKKGEGTLITSETIMNFDSATTLYPHWEIYEEDYQHITVNIVYTSSVRDGYVYDALRFEIDEKRTVNVMKTMFNEIAIDLLPLHPTDDSIYGVFSFSETECIRAYGQYLDMDYVVDNTLTLYAMIVE